jgi:putative glutamine amidotransferase
MSRTLKKPVVGIPCDHRMIGPHPFHAVGEKYIAAVRDGAGAIPLLIPVLENPIAFEEILAIVDGIFLTGSPSNVAPSNYDGPAAREGVLQDKRRDGTTLPLIRQVVEAGKPLFAVCRGFQEFNVAYGGTLHQHVQEVPGRFDHREDKNASLDVQYAPAHDVELTRGGLLERIAGTHTVKVNSLHAQGVDRLADGLAVEAVAADGTIEAFRATNTRTFALGVQWHPEWKFRENAFSTGLFEAFGQSLRTQA